MLESHRRKSPGAWRIRLLGVLLGTTMVVLGIPSAAQAVPDEPTVVLEDGGDGFLNASEVGGVMLSGTYDNANPAITGVIARIVPSATCDDVPGTATQSATLDPVAGTWEAGPFDLSDGALFPEGAEICARARAQEGAVTSDLATSNVSVKDTVPPAAGTVDIVDGNGFVNSAGDPADWENSDPDADSATVWFEQDAATPAGCGPFAVAASGSGSLNATCFGNLDQGPFSFNATWADAAGNVSAEAVDASVKDTLPPAPPAIATPGEGFLTNNPVVTVSGTTEPNALVQVRTPSPGSTTLGSTTADGLGDWTIGLTFAEGTHSIRARARDEAGNQGAHSALRTFTVDLTAPDAPVITDPGDGALFNTTSVTFDGTAEPGSSVRLRRGNSNVGSAVIADVDGNWSRTVSLAEATHAMSARATDPAGNVSALADIVNVTIDITPPGPGTVDIDDGDGFVNADAIASGLVPGTWEAVDPDAVSATVWFEQAGSIPAGCGPFTAGESGSVSLSTECGGNLDEGLFSFKATWADLAGNVSASSEATSVKDSLAPDITVSVDGTGSFEGADGIVTPDDVAAGVEISYEVTEAGPDVTLTVANVGAEAPEACVFDGLGRGPTTFSVDADCFAELDHGPFAVTVDGEDLAGNLGSGSDEAHLRLIAGAFEGVISGAIHNFETGHIDDTLNYEDTQGGAKVTVLFDLSEDVLGVVDATLKVTDSAPGVASVVEVTKAMEFEGSEEARTIEANISTLQQGELTVELLVADGLGLQTLAVRTLLLDTEAPDTEWFTEDGAEFISVTVPFLGQVHNVRLEGRSADPGSLSGIQWVYLVMREASTGMHYDRLARRVSGEAPATDWFFQGPIPFGTWDVTAVSQDTAGNVDVGPTIRIFVDGL